MVDVFIKVLLFDILFSDIFSLKFSVENFRQIFCRKLLSKISVEIGYDNLIYNYVQIVCQTRVIFSADK